MRKAGTPHLSHQKVNIASRFNKFAKVNWTSFEIDLIIEDYFSMLKKELRNEQYNKTAHRRALLLKLPNRNKGSVEFKHQNISATLIELGLPYIKGYAPRFNYQHALAGKVVHRLNQESSLEKAFDAFANQSLEDTSNHIDYSKWNVAAPNIKELNEPAAVYRKPFKKNYIEEEQRNQSIGFNGEKLVYHYEVWRLKQTGRSDLATKVEWISREDDGAGFDILSKSNEGIDRFIEVKSTTLGKETPIYFSRSENEFSEKHQSQFHLYRVFDLNQKPRVFTRTGKFEGFCSMEAINYKGYFS